MAKTLKLQNISSFIAQFFQMKDHFFFNNIRNIDENILSESNSRISETLLFGISSFNDTKNTSILNTTIDYILSTKRFDVPLTNFRFFLKHLCIENTFFKFYNLFVNSFTKFFTILYCWFKRIEFAVPCQLGFSSNYHYFRVSVSTVFILFVH